MHLQTISVVIKNNSDDGETCEHCGKVAKLRDYEGTLMTSYLERLCRMCYDKKVKQVNSKSNMPGGRT